MRRGTLVDEWRDDFDLDADDLHWRDGKLQRVDWPRRVASGVIGVAAVLWGVYLLVAAGASRPTPLRRVFYLLLGAAVIACGVGVVRVSLLAIRVVMAALFLGSVAYLTMIGLGVYSNIVDLLIMVGVAVILAWVAGGPRIVLGY